MNEITNAFQRMQIDPSKDIKLSRQKEEVAFEFERIFAQQIVQQMTKGLFESADNKGVMQSGGSVYKDQIVETLSKELAKQEPLGVSEMIWNSSNQRIEK
ncbi:MAG: hypothetical protein WEB89_06720 [Balneolales bacterium]